MLFLDLKFSILFREHSHYIAKSKNKKAPEFTWGLNLQVKNFTKKMKRCTIREQLKIIKKNSMFGKKSKKIMKTMWTGISILMVVSMVIMYAVPAFY